MQAQTAVQNRLINSITQGDCIQHLRPTIDLIPTVNRTGSPPNLFFLTDPF
jgi:hypothetical protein